VTPQEMSQEGRRLSELLDGALAFLKEQIRAAAEAERDYRQAKARAWVEAPDGTAGAKEAWVNGHTADLRYKRDIAAGMERASHQAIRSRLAQISLLQSVANAHKAEASFDRYGPEAA
jgi:hypothetical protein